MMTTIHNPSNLVRYSAPPARGAMRNVKFQSLNNVNQSNEEIQFSGGKVGENTGLIKPLVQGSANCLKQNLRSVRNNSNRNETVSENVEPQKCSAEYTVEINNFLDSLPNSIDFSQKMENDAIEFWQSKKNIKGFDNFLSVLSASDSADESVQKVKQALVMTKMLHESCTDNDFSSLKTIKEDIQFLVNNVNKYKLGFNSPFSGSSSRGFKVRESINRFMNKISDEAILKGLDSNKAIHIMVMNKIDSVPDGDLRNILHKEWSSGPFRESIRVFDAMDNVIKSTKGFLRAGALFSHQPIKLDLLKDYLTQDGTSKNNNEKNKTPVKKDDDNGKENQGVTYIYNDHSTTVNDFSKIIIGDRTTINYNGDYTVKINTDLSEKQKETFFLSTDEHLQQHSGDGPKRQSASDIDGRRESQVDNRPEATAGMPHFGISTTTSIHETQAPPVIEGGHAGLDDIDGPVLQREASSTPDINVEQNMRTSVQQAQSQRVGTFIGPFSTGRTGAAQFQKYKQSASITSNSGLFGKKNASPITPSNDADTGIKNHGTRLRDENTSPRVKAGENPVSKKWVIDSPSDFLITPRTGGLQGPAELKRYVQEGNIRNNAKNNTQAGRREPLPGHNEKAHNVFEARPQKTAASPAQAMAQQQWLNSAAGINKQKSDTFMGPHRTGRTGAHAFKKYVSDSNASTVSHTQNSQSSIGHGVEPLANVVSSRTTERPVMNTADATIPANSGVMHTARVAQQKVRVEPETTPVEITDDGLRVDTVPDISASREPSSANRHQAASSGEKNPDTAAGNTAFKGPFWTGREGAAAKQSYFNTDRFAKKVNR